MTDDSGVAEPGSISASGVSWAVRDLLLAASAAHHAVARSMGLTLGDLTALDHLLDGRPLGTGELADRLGIRSPSATAVVDRLESDGLVQRVAHPTDRRRVVVEVSPQGRARVEQAVRPIVAGLDALASRLTTAEQEALSDHLHAVAGVLRDHGGH